MSIPDKYRDRYDRLAASHPWMHEMRDEPELTVYNEASDDELFRCSYCHCKVYNIDMTEGDCGWGFTFCPQCGGEVYESDSRKIEAKLGEPTNGIGGETNGITDEITLPEGDAVAIMRDLRGCVDVPMLKDTLCRETGTHNIVSALETLADMIKRDYVRRDDYDFMTDALKYMKAERDEWKAKAEQAASSTCSNGTANRTGNGTCPDSDETCPNDVDSREKLEADALSFANGFIRDHNGAISWNDELYRGIVELLDRQAAITANETSHDNPYVGLVRGKQWERTEISDYYCGRCGWKVTDHDSYCPECGGALHKASNKPDSKFDARKTAETPETDAAKDDIRDFDDSREKLEADITHQFSMWFGNSPYPSQGHRTAVEWLNRQEAITERECRQREYAEGDVYRKVYTKSHIDEMIRDAKIELELQRDRNAELQAAIDQQRAATANANDLWGRTRDELAAVKAERDNLADDLLASNREREHLRRTLGIALDHAHDMLALVNLDGEVVS